ncbi:hypothetical protein ASZ78_015785 [Callipepla squamata]|uniref:Ubiquitin thioesterase OTU n=1 Tax=Callipepla squamata TaxID=9009 RepID=A0A226NHZ5_CALSU|nr:hypothetical protein ASZ78_015785 [Callipepla squamata]
MLRLRCKARSGTQPLPGLTAHSRLRDMQAALAALTGVPAPAQRLLLGFPPRSLDLSDGERRLGELGIHSGVRFCASPALRSPLSLTGDTLIVEEDTSKPAAGSPVVAKRMMAVRDAVPVLARRVVPADNSCLFTSVYYVVEGGVYDPGCAPEMRSLIAQIVASDPEAYCEAVLGKTNREYCDWIRREETWGGAIEVSILSKFYQCEICVVDTQTVRIDRFGEDAGYTKRVLLIYDGIHYDPLERKIPDSDVPPQTIFSTTDDVVLAQALELADEARRKRQFTDVNRFTLRCMVCQKGLTGQVEAREHAKETGHTNFGEV